MSQLSNIKSFLFVGMMVLVAIFLAINVLSGGGNQIGTTLVWMSCFGTVLGFLFPRASLYLFLGSQFYIDFIKRLLVFGDEMNMTDVMVSLGVGPIIVVAACFSCVVHYLQGRVPFRVFPDLIFLAACVLVSLIGMVLPAESMVQRGQNMIGTAMIGMPAWASFVLLRGARDPYHAFRIMALCAIPMGVYAMVQAWHGIFVWEERYILQGYSQVLYNFYIMDGVHMRPFSTVNTHTSLGTIAAVLCLFCGLLLCRKNDLFQEKNDRAKYILLALFYLAVCLISRNRTTYFLPILAWIFAWAFKGGIRTAFIYTVFFGFGIWLIAMSPWLYDRIFVWSKIVAETKFGEIFGNIETYKERLLGFTALTEARNWSMFGLPENQRPYSHDMLTKLLVTVGYLPCGLLVLVGVLFLFWWHRRILHIQDPAKRLLLVRITAITAALTLCGLAYGNLLFVAPVNAFLGVLVGLATVIYYHRPEGAVSLEETPAIAAEMPSLFPEKHRALQGGLPSGPRTRSEWT